MQKINEYAPYITLIVSIFSTIALAVTSYLLIHMQMVEVDLAAIKGNRFTAQDGIDLERRFGRGMADLENKVVKQDQQLIEIHKTLIESPPKWLVDDVKLIRTILEKILEKLTTLELRVQRNEDRIHQHQRQSGDIIGR